MENKAHALAAGLFVAVLSALLVALAAWLTADTGEHRVYEISSAQPVNGLQPQAAVRYKGVAVGKVTDIGFDPKAAGNVLVRLSLSDGAPVTAATYASLGFQGVTGLAFVQLDDEGSNRTPLVTSDAQPARIPMRAGLLSRLSDQGVAILERIEQTSERINQLLAPANQQQLMTTIERFGQSASSIQQMAERIEKLSAHVDGLLSAQLGPQRVDVPRLVDDAGQTLKALQRSADSVERTAAEFRGTATAFTALAERLNAKGGAVDRLTESAAALTQGALALTESGKSFNGGTLPRLNRTSDETTRAARQINRAVNAVSDNPQSLIFGNGVIAPGPGEPGFSAAKGKP